MFSKEMKKPQIGFEFRNQPNHTKNLQVYKNPSTKFIFPITAFMLIKDQLEMGVKC